MHYKACICTACENTSPCKGVGKYRCCSKYLENNFMEEWTCEDSTEWVTNV